MSANTLRAYQSDLLQFQQYAEEVLCLDDVAELSPRQVRLWLTHLVDEGLEATSIRRKWSAVSSFFTFLMDHGHVDDHPLAGLKTPKVSKRLPRYLRSNQLADLAAVLPALGSEDYGQARDRAIIMLFLTTGLRRQELVDLDLSSVRMSEGVLRVRGKGGKTRQVPISSVLTTELEAYLGVREQLSSEGPLFLTDGSKRLYPKYVYNVVKRYTAEMAGGVAYSPHKLRHTFATLLLDKGADMNAIKTLLGHANLGATQIYTHTSIEHIKAVYKSAHPKMND